jgi:uncharacterized protein YfkK (UPF0435 family)
MRMFIHETPNLQINEGQVDSLEINPERQIKMKKEIQISPEKLEKKFLELSKPSPRYKFLRNLPPEDFLNLLGSDKLYFDIKNAPKFNMALTAMRKFRKLQTFQREEIKKCFEFITNNLNQLSMEDISALAVNLQKMKITDIEFYQKIERFVLEKAALFSVRALANILHSFIFISKKQSVISDFLPFFRNLETILALKIRNESIFDSKSLCQIAVAYSKTQNFSKEFLYFVEQTSLEHFDKLSPAEMTQIAYSLFKNKIESNNIFTALGI